MGEPFSQAVDDSKAPRAYVVALAALLAASLALRLAYLTAQPGSDPYLGRPLLDGSYYTNWARSLATGGEMVAGAFYLAPLYPYLLAAQFAIFGDGTLAPLMLQHLSTLAAVAALAEHARREASVAAALATAGLFLFYQPLLFFPSCPLGESLAIFLLSLAMLAARGGKRAGLAAGLLGGFAALARPNLLLVPIVWAGGELVRRRRKSALLLAVGVALVVLPVLLRNRSASGHWVPISSNVGVTAYSGNGPGALGTYTRQFGLSGRLDRQREEATALAERLSGRELDPVKADRWLGAEALRLRLAAPGDTARLLVRRAVLLFDSWEYGLGYHPMLDANPFRLTWRVAGPRGLPPAELPILPFGAILGLAVAGLVLGGVGGSGGWRTWAALAALAATPLLFYVSSRYRLPFAAFLVVPAGAGLVGLIRGDVSPRRRLLAAGLGLVFFVASFAAPWPELRRTGLAAALSNRAAAHEAAGNMQAAERDARRALEVSDRHDDAWFNLGVILERSDRIQEAEEAYRRALALNPRHAEAAGNLAGQLIRRGREAEALPILRRALIAWPAHRVCWTNLVVGLTQQGDIASARRAVAEARRNGVAFDPGLLRAIGFDAGR